MGERVTVGRVGKPHGLDGAFFVEAASEDPRWFKLGARLFAGGEELAVVVARHGSQGRPVIRLEQPVARGELLEVPFEALPPVGEGEYYRFQLVGLEVVEEGGRRSAGSRSWSPVSRTTSSRSKEGFCCRSSKHVSATSTSSKDISLSRPASAIPSNPLQLDVFTLTPHAFSSLTEQRPVASVLGTSLDLRLFSYRDTTPLRAGQVDDEPYGGGAGMVLRVDVVSAALEAAYGGLPSHRVVALSPQGRQLTQAIVEELVQETAPDAPLGPVRGVRRACRRAPGHRLDLDRAIRALEWRPAGDGARGCDRQAPPGRTRRGLRRARILLRRARG